MKISEELRKQQLAVTADFKSRAQKAEKILGEIDICQNTLASLNESLSAVLGIDAVQAKKAAKPPKAKSAKAAKVIPTVKPPAAPSLRDAACAFLATQSKPMGIAEIVQAMQKAGHVFKASNPVVAMRILIYNNKKIFKKVARGKFVAATAIVQKPAVDPAAKAAKTVKAKPAAPATAAAKPSAGKSNAPTLKSSVRDFLLKAGKPMRIAEIVLAMKKAGHVFQARKPVAAMSLLLYSNKKVFKKVKPGTFKAV